MATFDLVILLVAVAALATGAFGMVAGRRRFAACAPTLPACGRCRHRLSHAPGSGRPERSGLPERSAACPECGRDLVRVGIVDERWPDRRAWLGGLACLVLVAAGLAGLASFVARQRFEVRSTQAIVLGAWTADPADGERLLVGVTSRWRGRLLRVEGLPPADARRDAWFALPPPDAARRLSAMFGPTIAGPTLRTSGIGRAALENAGYVPVGIDAVDDPELGEWARQVAQRGISGAVARNQQRHGDVRTLGVVASAIPGNGFGPDEYGETRRWFADGSVIGSGRLGALVGLEYRDLRFAVPPAGLGAGTFALALGLGLAAAAWCRWARFRRVAPGGIDWSRVAAARADAAGGRSSGGMPPRPTRRSGERGVDAPPGDAAGSAAPW